MAFRQLQIVLGLGGLIAGRDFAVSPVRLLQCLANTQDFFTGKQAGNMQEHDAVPDSKEMAMVLILIDRVKR